MPPVDLNNLPAPLRAYVRDISERACLPPDYFIPALLVTLATVIGNRIRVQPKRRDDFLVVVNLWACLIAFSGSMKSYAMKAFIHFLETIETGLRKRYEEEAFKKAGEREDLELHEAALHERRKKAAKNGQHGDIANAREELDEIRRKLEELHVPIPRLVVMDATPEKEIEILHDNPDGILAAVDELLGWFHVLAKQGREGQRAYSLSTWDGDQPFIQDRIGRGTVSVPIATVSRYGTLQPGPFRAMQDEAIAGGSGADGLLQRFQVAVWPDENLPAYELVDREPDHQARERVQRIYSAMHALDPANFGQTGGFVGFRSEIPGTQPGILRFDDEAQELFDAWIVDLENRLRSPRARAHRAYLSHISKYRSLLPSLAGILHLVEVADQESTAETYETPPSRDRISLATATNAVALVDYLDAHARKIYATEIDSDRAAAARLLDHLAAGHAEDGVTVSTLQRKGWTGLDRPNLDEALAYLEPRGWLRVERLKPGEKGGRPSTVVRIHPNIAELWEGDR